MIRSSRSSFTLIFKIMVFGVGSVLTTFVAGRSSVRRSRKTFLLTAQHSMQREWVLTEIAHARQRELREKRQVLCPISLVSYSVLEQWRCFDAVPNFSNWQSNEFYRQALRVRDLKTEVN